jgi:hypothetical protein
LKISRNLVLAIMDSLNTNGPVPTKPGHVWTAPSAQEKNDAD